MKNAIVLFPVIGKKLDKDILENKLLETVNLAKAINLKIIYKEYFFLRKPEPKALIRKGKINYFQTIYVRLKN